MNVRGNQSPESVVRDIRRITRRKFSSEEKINERKGESYRYS